MKTIIGIDPGKSGGIAVMVEGEVVATHKLSAMTAKDIWLTLCELEPATVYLEKVHAGPRMGSSAAFKFGIGYGSLLTAIQSAGLRLELVAPQRWQKTFGLIVKGRGLGQGDTAKKNRNKAKAQELFPQLKITHAIADALLIAEHGVRAEI